MSIRSTVLHLAAAAVVASTLAACGDGDTAAPEVTATNSPSSSESTGTTAAEPTSPPSVIDDDPDDSTTTAPADTDTSEAVPPPETTPTTEEVEPLPAPCPAGPAIPADAAAGDTIAADLDLDGLDETVSTYFAPGDSRWHLRVEWGSGGTTDQIVTDSNGATPTRPIGPHDVDGDGTPELFAVVGSGASTALIGLYDVGPCQVHRVTLDGAPAVFPVGATVGTVSGLSCGPVGDLDAHFAENTGGDMFEGGFAPHSLAGSVLTPGFGDGATFTGDEAAALATFDCGSLVL